MKTYCAILFFLLCITPAQPQSSSISKDTITIENDTLKKAEFLKQLGNGYYSTKFFNLDLRYLIKYNQYEGFRTGLGGITNTAFSEKYRINGYLVYGFRDHGFKYSVGGGFRVAPETQTWINFSYTNDLQETGSSAFLTDKRFFSFFEPRLLNIDLFHWQITKAISIEHKFSTDLISELQFAISKIDPTYDYTFVANDTTYDGFDISMAKLSLQWSPFRKHVTVNEKAIEISEGFPQFTLQLTKSFKNVINGDFNFFKTDFRTLYKLNYNDDVFTEVNLTSGIAIGTTPLTHLYHAYPNNINKETILQRFSVAGINSFETMFFNEFFSDRFATLQLKHYIKPFKITERYRPQLVLISRFALGDMSHKERHQNMNFGTLSKGYSEAGFEINKLLFGFGLSFAYRYGAYHLPKREDNMAFKFTFNVTL
ncbi:hypothetical protein ACS386_01400 [Flavobacteriaceae bacterium LMO-SS05]